MEIKFTEKESEEIFYNALCNGLYELPQYGLVVKYDEKAYKASKARLQKNKSTLNKGICYEDILMELLRSGHELKVIDTEMDGEYSRSITIKDIHERITKTPLEHLTDVIRGNDDAITADVVLQTVFFEEVIFG